jgi:hypothetical protein
MGVIGSGVSTVGTGGSGVLLAWATAVGSAVWVTVGVALGGGVLVDVAVGAGRVMVITTVSLSSTSLFPTSRWILGASTTTW